MLGGKDTLDVGQGRTRGGGGEGRWGGSLGGMLGSGVGEDGDGTSYFQGDDGTFGDGCPFLHPSSALPYLV